MKRFVAGGDREQSTLLPECRDDFIDESNPVRVIDAFVDALDLADLGFDGVEPAATGRPAYHPSTLLKLYISTAISTECSQAVGWSARPVATWRRCGSWAGLYRITRRLPTSARTMVRQSARSAPASSSCAERWAC